MKHIVSTLAISLLFGSTTIDAQAIKLTKDRLLPNMVSMSFGRVMGKEALRVVKDSTVQKVD